MLVQVGIPRWIRQALQSSWPMNARPQSQLSFTAQALEHPGRLANIFSNIRLLLSVINQQLSASQVLPRCSGSASYPTVPNNLRCTWTANTSFTMASGSYSHWKPTCSDHVGRARYAAWEALLCLWCTSPVGKNHERKGAHTRYTYSKLCKEVHSRRKH